MFRVSAALPRVGGCVKWMPFLCKEWAVLPTSLRGRWQEVRGSLGVHRHVVNMQLLLYALEKPSLCEHVELCSWGRIMAEQERLWSGHALCLAGWHSSPLLRCVRLPWLRLCSLQNTRAQELTCWIRPICCSIPFHTVAVQLPWRAETQARLPPGVASWLWCSELYCLWIQRLPIVMVAGSH